MVIHHDRAGFFLEMWSWFNICKPMNIINHINSLKDKNNMIISIDVVKAFGKVQCAFMIKVTERRTARDTHAHN